MRKNGSLLSRVVDPPGTKGGPRVGNFPGPPKNTFCPGWSHDPGQKGLLSRAVASPGTKRGPLYMSLLPPPSSNNWAQFLICAAPPSSPLLPSCLLLRRRPRAPSTSPTNLDCRLSSVASTPRPPWTTTPPGCSPVRRRPSPVPPRLRRLGLHSARALIFAAPGGLHCTPPRRRPLRCAPPRRQLRLVVQGRRPSFPRPV